jgi:histidinol-phosphate aminotransferase
LNELENLVARYPQHTFILDPVYGHLSLESFAPFGVYANVFVLGSLSKFFGLAGLRIGYALGQRLPEGFSMHLGLSHHALNVSLAALNQKDYYQKNRDEGLAYAQNLSRMEFQNLVCLPSQATFVLVKLNPPCEDGWLRQKEAEHHLCTKHILQGDSVQYLRICLGPQEVFSRVVDFLKSLNDL